MSLLCVAALVLCSQPPSSPCSLTFLDDLKEWESVTTDASLKVTFEEPAWPVNQPLFGNWTVNGVSFQGFAGEPAPNIYVADFDAPFGSPQWMTANGDENINIVPAAPVTAFAFDVTSNNLGEATISVFDTGGLLLGSLDIPANVVRFVGITSGTAIGHVNFSSTLGALVDTGFDNIRIALFTPSPTLDLDGDGDVDGADLGLLIGGWGFPGSGDLNCDGTVDGADLGLLIAGWTG